jgi:hypothetical protein
MPVIAIVSCVSNIELQLIMRENRHKLSDQQTRSPLVFASSTWSIQTTQRYIDGDSDAQRKLVLVI